MYRTLLAVAQRKCWLIDNYFKEYKHLKTAEPHEQRAVHFFPAQFAIKNSPEQLPEMVTTQVAPDSESTCGTAVCVVSFNTNLSNFTNRAGQNLQVGVLKKHESNCFLVGG